MSLVSRAGLPAASWVTSGLCSQSPSVPRLHGHPKTGRARGCSPRHLWAPSLAGSQERTPPAHPQSHPKTWEKGSKGGEERALPAAMLDPFPRPRSLGRSLPLRPGSGAGIFGTSRSWRMAAAGSERGEGTELALRGHPWLVEQKGRPGGTGKLRAAVVGWHGEHLPPGICRTGGEKGKRVRRMDRNPCGQLM